MSFVLRKEERKVAKNDSRIFQVDTAKTNRMEKLFIERDVFFLNCCVYAGYSLFSVLLKRRNAMAKLVHFALAVSKVALVAQRVWSLS